MKIDKVKKIGEIIEILKTNPKIEFVYNGKELGPCEIGIAYPNYPSWVYEIEKLFEPVLNYLEVTKAIKKHKKEVADFNLLETRAALTYFVRGERFCDGHMASCIENGCLLQWLSRYKELLEENVWPNKNLMQWLSKCMIRV